MPVPHCFDDYSLKSGSVIFPALFIFLSIFFGFLGVFCGSTQILEGYFYTSVKKVIGNVMEIALNGF